MTTKEWKWSNGEENIRSPRSKIMNLINVDNNIDTTDQISCQNQNAITQSLEGCDSFTFEPLFSRNDSDSGKMREDLDDKISNRELIFQRGTNPFLQSSSYVKDIVARDIFLKPKNTTFDKINNTE
jgi:hypothetical protein